MTDFDLLSAYLDATPTEAELDLLQRVRGFVVGLGLYLPAHSVSWYTTTMPGLPLGLTHPRCRPILVQLRAALAPRELVGVVLHELQHVADSRDHPDLLIGDLEARAYAFQRRWTAAACTSVGVR